MVGGAAVETLFIKTSWAFAGVCVFVGRLEPSEI